MIDLLRVLNWEMVDGSIYDSIELAMYKWSPAVFRERTWASRPEIMTY
jgi:hypothetical protein